MYVLLPESALCNNVAWHLCSCCPKIPRDFSMQNTVIPPHTLCAGPYVPSSQAAPSQQAATAATPKTAEVKVNIYSANIDSANIDSAKVDSANQIWYVSSAVLS